MRLILSLAYLVFEIARAPEDLVSFKTLFAVAFAVYAGFDRGLSVTGENPELGAVDSVR